MREDTAVARPSRGVSWLAGRTVKHYELAFGLEGGGGYERFAGEDAGIGDEVAGGRVVGAVKDEVVLGYEGEGDCGVEIEGVGVVGRVRVETT